MAKQSQNSKTEKSSVAQVAGETTQNLQTGSTPQRELAIVLAGGGTAGHVNPLLATAAELKKQNPAAQLTVVGTVQGLENELVPAAGLPLHTIARVPFPRRPNLAALKFFSRFKKAISQAEEIISQTNADIVVGFGGYVCPPMYLAARKRGVKIVVHEGNAQAGLANKLGARFAHLVALSFQNTALQAKRGKTVVTGLPLRREIQELVQTPPSAAVRQATAAKYGLDPQQPVLVVTGGSLGSVHLNQVIAQSAPAILQAGFQILHITGKGKAAQVRAQVAHLPGNYQILEYAQQMHEIYTFASLVLTRAGAGMVCELAACGIPAVFVPLAIGNGEQAKNAADLVAAGGAILIADQDFTESAVRSQVLPLLNQEKLAQMAQRARDIARADAAAALAKLILS